MSTSSSSAAEKDSKREFLKNLFIVFVVLFIFFLIFFAKHHENNKFKKGKKMIEPLLCGIVLGLVPITLLGLFVSAWNQYRRGSGMLDID